MTVDDVIQQSTLTGLILRLPPVQLDRKIYEGVKKRLEGIGGKWKGGKTAGFVFSVDPSERLEAIRAGEKINLKQDYQFFATPPDLANWMVLRAAIEPHHKILEPSAGDGALVMEISRRFPSIVVDCFELMPENRIKLGYVGAANIIGGDFLEHPARAEYDRIVANPPFTRNQDIEHIRHMWDCLKPGGRLVTIASTHWAQADGRTRKHQEFRDWLYQIDGEYGPIEPGTFKESGTSVGAVLIVADKKGENR